MPYRTSKAYPHGLPTACDRRRYNADWYMYDDTTVRKVEGKEVAAQHFTVYLLVYQSRADVDLAAFACGRVLFL